MRKKGFLFEVVNGIKKLKDYEILRYKNKYGVLIYVYFITDKNKHILKEGLKEKDSIFKEEEKTLKWFIRKHRLKDIYRLSDLIKWISKNKWREEGLKC